MTNDWKNAPRMAAQDRWAGEITPLIPAASTTAQSGALAGCGRHQSHNDERGISQLPEITAE